MPCPKICTYCDLQYVTTVVLLFVPVSGTGWISGHLAKEDFFPTVNSRLSLWEWSNRDLTCVSDFKLIDVLVIGAELPNVATSRRSVLMR